MWDDEPPDHFVTCPECGGLPVEWCELCELAGEVAEWDARAWANEQYGELLDDCYRRG